MSAGNVFGVVLTIYFTLTLIIGIYLQSVSKRTSRELFSEFPTSQIVFHVLISLFLILSCFLNSVYVPLLSTGLCLWFVKIICNICCLREHQAFNNMRSIQNTEAFLNGIRQKVPVASFYCECFHYDTVYYRDVNGYSQTRTEKRITYRQHRYVQILGMIDHTPALYVTGQAPLIYLKLKEQILWLGDSDLMLTEISNQIYFENRYFDTYCTVDFSVEIPGLTSQNFLKRGHYPSWMNQKLLWISNILQFDVLYICMLRSRIPKTKLLVIKSCSIDPNYQLDQPQVHLDKITIPNLDVICPSNIDQISPPNILDENKQPYYTDIKPQYFDTFDINIEYQYDKQNETLNTKVDQPIDYYTIQPGAVI
ncbi:Transmembrane_domain-containing protein [Hexamita inflata]|uniref:Transmembrane domain-containing protein n=1 Tax=Hexamita inflata TaxID=28002 RepID=A0AA86NHZ5_9EUKA|nr:Transmembrane domain-containing protein [Hexamita inflata]